MTKAWILTIPLFVLVGCRRGEQPYEAPADGTWETPGQSEPQPGQQPFDTNAAQQGDPGQMGQMEPGQMGQMEPGQMGQMEPGQMEPGQMGQMEPGQMGQMEPGQQAQAPQFRDAVAQVRANAQQIRASRDLRHEDVVNGFYAVTTAIGSMPNAAGADLTSITAYTNQLAASDPTSMEHTGLVKNALTEAVGTLESIARDQNLTGFETSLTQIRNEVAALDESTPLLEQKDAVANSFEQLAQVMNDMSQRPPTGTQ